MRAYVDKHLKRGFRLDQNRIQRLHTILEQHSGALGEPTYSVYRDDGALLAMDAVADVIAEPNDNTHRITRIVVSSNDESRVSLKLDFRSRAAEKKDETEPDTGAHLTAEADARETLMPVVGDLMAFLDQDVCTVWRPSPKGTMSALLGVLLLIQVASLFRLMRPPANATAQLQDALKSTALPVKLDALIQSQLHTTASSQSSVSWLLPLVGVMAVMLVLIVDPVRRGLWDFFWPTNLFLFGDEIGRQEKRASIRDKVLWGVVIALIVSVVSAVIVARFRLA